MVPLLRIEYTCKKCGYVCHTTINKVSEDLQNTLREKLCKCPICGQSMSSKMHSIKPPYWKQIKFNGTDSRIVQLSFLGEEVISLSGNEIFINAERLLNIGFAGNIIISSDGEEHYEQLDPFHKVMSTGRLAKRRRTRRINVANVNMDHLIVRTLDTEVDVPTTLDDAVPDFVIHTERRPIFRRR